MARKLDDHKQAIGPPPRWALKFFRWFCNDYLTEGVLGDLLEMHERRCIHGSKRRADILFIWNVIQFLQPFALRKKRPTFTPNSFAMANNSFKIAWRTLGRQKLFVAINVIGMSVAVACCIVSWCNYDFNAQFDKSNVNAKDVYRINSARLFQNKVTEFAFVPMPVAELVRQNVGDAKVLSRYSHSTEDIKIKDEMFPTTFSFVDPDFFSLFTFEFLEGNAASLADKSKIFISDTQAKKFFGNTPALGKTVTQVLPDNKLKDFTIGGVFKTPPTNSSFNDEVLIHYQNQLDENPRLKNGTDWMTNVTLFVRFDDSNRIASIEKEMLPFAKANNQVHDEFIISKFTLDRFEGMAMRDRDADREGTWTRPVISFAAVFGSIVMSVLIMLIACFNLTNTAISISSRRLKEIGMRKVMGGLRSQLIVQFMGETFFICAVSLGLGMVLAQTFLLPEFNKLWPYMQLEIHYLDNPMFLSFMAGILILTAILAGTYPAFYITRFQPNEILKGKTTIGGPGFLSNTLLTMQYAISLIAIINSLAFVNNAWYQRNFDLGFDHSGVLYTKVQNGNDYTTLKNALSIHPEIESIAGSAHHLYSSNYSQTFKGDGKEIETEVMDVGDNYIRTIGFKVIDGRDFLKDSKTDIKNSVIISEKLASKFGWDKPVGKQLVLQDSVQLTVVGVIKNPLTRSLWRETTPLLLRLTDEKNYTTLVVSTSAVNIVKVNGLMENYWKGLFPNKVYQGHYMEDKMAEAVIVNDNLIKSFGFLGVVALILSATGLFTLVSLNIIKRLKEIGIRKVYGASIGNIARVVNMKFAVMLVIASVLGTAGGIGFSTSLMGAIWHYYQPIGSGMVILAVLVLFLVSIFTIGFKIYKTAKLNPVATLKED